MENDVRPLSPRDETKVNIAGKEFDPDQLTPIPLPKINSTQVPKKLPSTLRRERVISVPVRSKVSSVNVGNHILSVPTRKKNAVATKVDDVPKREKGAGVFSTPPVSSPLLRTPPLTPVGRPISISDMPVYEPPVEEKQIRVIRAAPKGFLNIPNIPDYSILSVRRQEAMRVKFNLKLENIRKHYPNIPPFKEDEPLHIIHLKYTEYVRKVYADRTLIKYKIYLTIIFLILETILVKVFGLPVLGYTKDQLKQFAFYEHFLQEIIDRQKETGGDEWPAEIRIFIFMIFQVVAFVVVKYVSGILGEESTKGLREQITDVLFPKREVVTDSDGIVEAPGPAFDPTGLMGLVSGFIGVGGNKASNGPKTVDIDQHQVPFEE